LGKIPHFVQHYDIGGHPAKNEENEGQNVAEYFFFDLNRPVIKTS
jgi:hypothetical protein